MVCTWGHKICECELIVSVDGLFEDQRDGSHCFGNATRVHQLLHELKLCICRDAAHPEVFLNGLLKHLCWLTYLLKCFYEFELKGESDVLVCHVH